ncbi:hypothetical protein ACFQPG_09205 [Sphingomonas sp. GCM10030256]|uniref:hypothetical protein n=1 Tax=Sphingomonas sp. GCM10030256 TaxID=3273427 RepID=UPI0036105210
MAYGLSPRLFVENGPVNQATAAVYRRSPVGSTSRSWLALSRERRLTAVEAALHTP